MCQDFSLFRNYVQRLIVRFFSRRLRSTFWFRLCCAEDIQIVHEERLVREKMWTGWRRGAAHCKEPIPQISKQKFPEKELRGHGPNFHIHERFTRPICLFCCRKYVDRSWEYINRSQTHECGNWDWDRAILRKGIHKWDFLCSACTWMLDALESKCGK